MNRRLFLGCITGGVATVVSGAPRAVGAVDPAKAGLAASAEPASARFSLRVWVGLWNHPERLAELLAWCREYRTFLDEVALFTSATHAPLPLEVLERRARALGETLPRFRELGLAAGINHLVTLGHADEDVERSLREPWERLTDFDGSTAQVCYCASDPRFMAYVGRSYELLAGAGPDFIWIDDDLRLEGHGPVRFACFCESCLKLFGEETSRTWTREALVAALNGGEREQRLSLRREWLAHNRRYVTRVMRAIRQGVDRVNPRLVLGYMSADTSYTGREWEEWPQALAGPNRLRVKWRPGGGFYTDDSPTVLLGKAHAVGRQLSRLPATVTDRQYEHENYPYQRLKKSVTMATAEVAAAIGAGCTGAALNCLGAGNPFEEFRPYFVGLQTRKPFHDQAVAAFGDSPCEGIWLGLTQDQFATVNLDGNWFTSLAFGHDLRAFDELSELGLPMAYHPAGARVTLLAGDSPYQFTDEELERFLGGGVLLDGPALRCLEGRGLRQHIGFRLRASRKAESIEVLTDHPLNGRFAGWQRDCRSLILPGTTWLIEPTDAASRLLAEVVDLGWQRHGPTAGAFENEVGGRVVVAGYHPWRNLQSQAKVFQMRALCRWLSRDTLPAIVHSYARVVLWCRRTPEGSPAILLLNASMDPVDPLAILALDAPRFRLTRADGRTSILEPRGTDGPYRLFEVAKLGPWEPALLVAVPPA